MELLICGVVAMCSCGDAGLLRCGVVEWCSYGVV